MAAKKQEWIHLIKKIDTHNFARWFCVFFFVQKGHLALHTDRNLEVFGDDQSPELFFDSADLSNVSDVLNSTNHWAHLSNSFH